MKKKKLGLEQLTVKSFVTSMDDSTKETIQGGARSEIVCSASGVCICPSEDCETQISCDVTENEIVCFVNFPIDPIRWW